jgi:uncharacterized SAM-binding protein YcdF (DUF218 family)
MFVLKETVGSLGNPLTAAFFIAIVAALCRWRGSGRLARGLAVAAVAIAYLGSTPLVGNALLYALEHQYSAPGFVPAGDLRHVVVLGSSYRPESGLPVTSALDSEGLVRIVEGIRLTRGMRPVSLVASGGAPDGGVPVAVGYATLARELGVDDISLVELREPLNTAGEAQSVLRALGREPFLLVTSAYHMPRAVLLMEREGALPIPAPTGHRVRDPRSIGWRDFLPRASGLSNTERAMHEYLGLLAAKVGLQ